MANPKQIPILKIKLSRDNVRKGARAIALMFYVLAWIVGGAYLSYTDGGRDIFRTLDFGFAGLLSAGMMLMWWDRRPIRGAFGVGLMGLIPVIVTSVWLGSVVPQFGTYLRVRGEPIDLAVTSLASSRPDLPAYVRLTGHLLPERSLSENSTGRQENRTRTETIRVTPLVEAGWTPDDPVYVVAIDPPYTLNTEEVSVTGILYPVVAAPGEIAWIDSPAGVEMGPEFFQARANFSFTPEQLYLLSDSAPGQLLFMFVLFSLFTLGVMILVIKLSTD